MITAIMLDSNEIATAPWTGELAWGGAAKIITKLSCGDLIATTDGGDLIAIERKSPADLLNSIKDKHIFAQCASMRSFTKWCYVVVTGPLEATPSGKVITDGRVSGWDWDAVQGALIDIQEMGVRVVYCLGADEYEATVLRLCRRDRSAEKVIEPTARPREMSPGEAILCALPGIGWERAQRLLDEFDGHPGLALAWLTWTDNDLQANVQIAGIGKGVRNGVRSALKLHDGEWIEVCSIPF